MNSSPPDPAAIALLIDHLRAPLSRDTDRFAIGLQGLFDALRGAKFANDPGVGVATALPPSAGEMSAFLHDARPTLRSLDASGILADPWTAAGLRRDEVRNASALRWFLDPRGGHGCGDAPLAKILSRVSAALGAGFPERPSPGCSVSVEQCPDGDRASRVDIQIDDPSFFLVVEVKIDAPEQDRQLERYCAIAAARAAGARAWAVAYLTPDGRPPTTAGDLADHVVTLSWTQVAAALREASRDAAPIPRFLAASFASHISNL